MSITKTIEVKSPEDCPFLHLDGEGYVENSCEVLSHFLDDETIFNLKEVCGQGCGRIEKNEFPSYCPLLTEGIFVKKK